MEENVGEELGIFSLWWAWALALLIGTAMLLALLNPWFVNKATKTTRTSNSYITTVQTSLRTFKTQHDALDTRKIEFKDNLEMQQALNSQQRAITAQMKQEADKLQKDQIPSDIRTLIEKE